MSEELYFCLYLTSNEHYIVNNQIDEQAKILNCELKYYRQLKNGHIPMYREVKLIGSKESINRFKSWVRTEKLDNHIRK